MAAPARYAVAQVWLNGRRTVNTFDKDTEAMNFAKLMANQFKGNAVYFATLVERSTEAMEDDDGND